MAAWKMQVWQSQCGSGATRTLLVEPQSGTATLEYHLAISMRLNNGIYSVTGSYSHRKLWHVFQETCMRMFIVALFTKLRNKCPPTGEPVNKTGIVDYVECHSSANESTFVYLGMVRCQTYD